MIGDLGVILDIMKSTFASVSPIVFLIFGVFLAIWIFGVLGNAFMDFAETRIRFSRTEIHEIKQLVALAKGYGIRLDTKKIMREQKEKKGKATFERLAKKYGAFEMLE